MNVKRLDLGADIVVLPERDLIVLHPDLDYGQSLGAVMGTLPDLHADAAVGLVEQVTPRPRPESEPEPRRRVGWHRALVVVVLAVVMLWAPVTVQPAAAGPEFGPDWQAAVRSLGMTCFGEGAQHRMCRTRSGERISMRGYRHEDGSLYVSLGADQTKIIFVFDTASAARRYVAEHPAAILQGRAVVW